MPEMTPEQEALHALDRDLPRSDLSMAAQLESDRLRAAWERGEALPVWDREAAQLAWEARHPPKAPDPAELAASDPARPKGPARDRRPGPGHYFLDHALGL
jgi:hypothetical protein